MAKNPSAARLRFEGVRLEQPRAEGPPTEVLGGLDAVWDLTGVHALVGPSGSGKSSLLRLCNRLEVPSSGRVLLDDTDLATWDPLVLRRRMGMVFQRPTLFAGTVLDNLRVADPQVSLDEAAAVLAQVGLDAELVDRVGDRLSGGEAQRACLARTLLTRPDVVLMDEVTASLDGQNRHLIEHLSRRLADDGIGIVWVTHDVDQARRLADRISVVLDGTLLADDEVADYLDRAAEHGSGPSHDWDHDGEHDASGGS